ncbi:MAG: peptidoglycan glycosyltransferase [Flavobacteriaceae bacterium]|nr:MAG: peptidoglycan glycosyltransferase [Flavobacteriaceae bacterium]
MNVLKQMYFIIGVICTMFIVRIAYFQLFTNKYILNAVNTSIQAKVTIPQRGYIYDRNGKILVSNSPAYEVIVTPVAVKGKFDTLGFCNMLQIDKETFKAKLEKISSYSRIIPSTFASYITREEAAYIQEEIERYPGFEIRSKPIREYHGTAGGNIFGYVSEIGPEYIKKDSLYYQPGDFAGISGVEKSYEKVLRGTKGISYFKKDISGKNIGPYNGGDSDVKMVVGKDIHITIDKDLQEYAESLLKNKRGGIVAIEPKTGEILCMASSPEVNPNLFVGVDRKKYLSQLVNDSMNKPLYDRSVQAQYPPGSPFKLLTALAAMQMQVLDTASTYVCRKRYHKKKNYCHCGTFGRPIKVETAIAKSCNTFFSETYRSMIDKDSTDKRKGFNQWSEIMKSFGLGDFLHNDLAVGNKGNIPKYELYDKYYGKDKWNSLSVTSNGIGQGEITTTAIQMANFTAAIANQGKYITPHIIKKIDNSTKEIDPKYKTFKQTLVESKYFKFIIEGMKKVITMGTAKKIFTNSFTQAGKTGTAQNSQGQDHSLFTLIAPVENPRIAVAVIIENGHYGATWAAPISSLVAEKYLMGEVKRKSIESRMKSGNLNGEYRRQWINYLKKIGKYEPPKPVVDSLTPKKDSLAKVNRP